MEIINAIIYTIGQGFAFNIILPIWYLLIKFAGK